MISRTTTAWTQGFTFAELTDLASRINKSRALAAILGMNPYRTATLREGKAKNQLNLTRGINLKAIGIQIVCTACIVGACDTCKKGSGPFTTCCVLEGFAAGSCANCHWNSD
jgi:hypothetical protein